LYRTAQHPHRHLLMLISANMRIWLRLKAPNREPPTPCPKRLSWNWPTGTKLRRN